METQLEPKQFLTLAEAEHFTGLSRVTLWRRHKRGGLPLIRVGGSTRIALADLEAFMLRHREGVPKN